MNSAKQNPKWWQLYLTFPLLIALFAMDNRLKISAHGHVAVQIGIILLVYGLSHLWLKANALALSGIDREKYDGTIRVIRIPVHQIPESNVEKRWLLQLPASEIKGILSDTVEPPYIDAESFPVEDVPVNRQGEK